MAKLIRISDGAGDSGAFSKSFKKTKKGYKFVSNRPVVGCFMQVGAIYARNYQYQDFWQTMEIIEILEDKELYVKFKTKNSIYEWYG